MGFLLFYKKENPNFPLKKMEIKKMSKIYNNGAAIEPLKKLL
jgi:hypothetical protein